MGKAANIKWNRALGIIRELSKRRHFISPSRNYCIQCCALLHMEKEPSNKNRKIHAENILCKATQTYFTLALNLESAIDPNQREGKPG